MDEFGEDHGRAEAGRRFERKMTPLLDLMTKTKGAEEVFLNGDRAWLAIGEHPEPISWTGLAPLTPADVRGAIRNAAVFGAREFGSRSPAKPTLTVKVPPRWRVSAMMPPSVDTWQVSIRHLQALTLTLQDYEAAGIMTPGQRREIEELLDAKKNVIVSGGTRSGKTTLLGAMLRRVAEQERIFLIEDTPELVIEGRDVVQSRTCPEEDLASLLRQALRMSPDRIVLGEVRGPEALELITAANTGHEGCLCTLHSNGREQTLTRLHTQVRKLQPSFPFEEVTAAVDAVVQIDGRGSARRVTDIWRVPR